MKAKNKEQYIKQWKDHVNQLHCVASDSDLETSGKIRDTITDMCTLIEQVGNELERDSIFEDPFEEIFG